jgi:hypothetical protein
MDERLDPFPPNARPTGRRHSNLAQLARRVAMMVFFALFAAPADEQLWARMSPGKKSPRGSPALHDPPPAPPPPAPPPAFTAYRWN